uniref:Ig-like domain-containing protein n=1 Tax=Ditylenchus dipsaci TaxID=166011 RepID=A0A915CRG9_9BILA
MAERITATAYQSVNLTCSVESRTPFTVYWLYGSVVIGGPLFYQHTDTSIWTIDAVTPAHRGHYICQVASTAGNHSAVTYLDSKEPPPHITATRNESVILRGTAYLHCRTQSIEQAQIRWIRKGVHIGNSAKIYMSPNGTLRILDSTHEDAGAYICRASYRLFECDGGPEARIYPTEVYVAKDSMFNLSCHVRGVPQPDVAWYFDGMKIVPDSKFYVNYKNELLVSDVESDDIGVYECRATNPAGIKTDYATVRLAIPPEVHITQDRQMITRGDLVIIDCRVIVGTPAPKISWYKNGREIASDRYLVIQEGRLTIRTAEESDAGTYACKAENMAGSDIKPVSLAIGSAPSIVPSPEHVYVNIDRSVSLQCRALGVPKPTISWLKNGVPISDFGDHFVILPDDSLLLQAVQLEDQARYSCVAKNSFGDQQRQTLLTVTGLVSPILAHVPRRCN